MKQSTVFFTWRAIFFLSLVFLWSTNSFAALEAPGSLSGYVPASVSNQKMKEELESRIKSKLDEELGRVTGGALSEGDITTYLQVLDHYANGEVEQARNLAGEKFAEIALNAVLGSSAGVITWAWGFAKSSYSEVQQWAENESRKYFIRNFLIPRVEKWRKGEGSFADISQLDHQFDEWFEFPENYKAITATKPVLARDKWITQLKDEMWAKTLALAVKYRKYHDQIGRLKKRSKTKKQQLFLFASSQYRSLLQEAAAEKKNVVEYLSEKESPIDIPQAPPAQGTSAPSPESNKQPDEIAQRDGIKEDPENDSENEADKLQEIPDQQPKCTNIDPEQRHARLQNLWAQIAWDEWEQFQKSTTQQIAGFNDALAGLYDGTVDWSYFAHLAKPFLQKTPDEPKVPSGQYIYDPLCEENIYVSTPDSIRNTVTKKWQQQKAWHQEVEPLYQGEADRRLAIFDTLKEHVKNVDEEQKIIDSLEPSFADLNPQEKFYKHELNNPFPETINQYTVATYQLAIIGFTFKENENAIIQNTAGVLNEAMAAADQSEAELERLLSYVEDKIVEWESILKKEEENTALTVDRMSKWLNDRMNLLGGGQTKTANFLRKIQRLGSSLQKKQEDLEQFRSTAVTLIAETDRARRRFAQIRQEINIIFANNRLYDKASEAAKNVVPGLEQYWPIYQLKNQFEYERDNKSIHISLTTKSPQDLIDEWQKGGLLQPMLVTAMVEIAGQKWYQNLEQLSRKEVDKFINSFSEAEKFYDTYAGKKILPVDVYHPLPRLFKEVQLKAENILVTLSKQYILISGKNPLKNYQPHLYDSFQSFREVMEKIKAQHPAMFGIKVVPVQEESPAFKTNQDENKYLSRENITAFYEEFAQQYSSRNTAAVLKLLADGWTSGDGTDLYDLEEYLDNSFGVFDAISYRVENLTHAPLHYSTEASISYTAVIKGQIFDQDLQHEEKNVVQEMVGIKDGKIRILKTINGQFWR